MSKTILLFGLLSLGACATNSDLSAKDEARAQASATLSFDRDFITTAASGGEFEVQSSRLAVSRQAPVDTTAFAETMIRDHSQANEDLAGIATAKSIELPQTLLPEHAEALEQLRSVPAEQFPEAFERIQDQAHRDTIALFERCAKECQDNEIRAFALNTLPTLRQHLQHVEELEATARR